MTPKRNLLILLITFTLGACAPPLTPTQAPASLTPALERPTETAPAPTPEPSPTLGPTEPPPSATPVPIAEVCSPLADIAISQLPDHLANPFLPPAFGSDNAHQGIDLATFYADSGVTIKGHPIQAVLSGEVAAVIENRFPYGQALLIESPLVGLPDLVLPTPIAEPLTSPSLTCPGVTTYTFEKTARSIYILYAHMESTSTLSVGDRVACGQPIGTIGDSGNVLVPHVHIETRAGPAEARFASIAHYDASASPEEMDNYCTWRVSGWFQVFDPFALIR